MPPDQEDVLLLKEQKLYLNALTFEVTRKCNLNCMHCFCGEPEDLNLPENVIDKVLDQVERVKRIALTGGEPMLVPDIVEHIVDKIIKNHTKLLAFTCVVNGTIMDDRAISFMNSFNRIATYINDTYREQWGGQDYGHKVAEIIISVDEYHKNDPGKALNLYKKYANNLVHVITQNNIEDLMEYRNRKKSKGLPDIDNAGRAEINNIGYNKCHCRSEYDRNIECCSICHRVEADEDERHMIKCPILISANGNVSIMGQISYAYRDKYAMGNVLKSSILDMITEWQWNEPLLCREVDELMKLETLLGAPECPEEVKKISEIIKHYILLKREFIKRAHKIYPNLPYPDIVDGVNAELNIHTDGMFTKTLSEVLPEYYDKNYVYNRDVEQGVCDSLLLKNYSLYDNGYGLNNSYNYTSNIVDLFNSMLKFI